MLYKLLTIFIRYVLPLKENGKTTSMSPILARLIIEPICISYRNLNQDPYSLSVGPIWLISA
jgi:hypothetical protein